MRLEQVEDIGLRKLAKFREKSFIGLKGLQIEVGETVESAEGQRENGYVVKLREVSIEVEEKGGSGVSCVVFLKIQQEFDQSFLERGTIILADLD